MQLITIFKSIKGFYSVKNIFIFLVFCSITMPGFCFTKTPGMVTEKAPVRIDSTILATEIGKAKKGSVVEIIDENYDWYKLRLPDYFSAFVHSSYVDPLKSNRNKGIVKATNLNIRNKPSLDSEVIGQLSQGEAVFIQGHRGEWLKINPYPHSTGWIHKHYVKLDQNTSSTNFTTKGQALKSPDKGIEQPKEEPPTEKAIAKGILLQTKDIYNRNIYKLKNPNGAISLKMDLTHDPEEYISQKVEIWGNLEKIGQSYYLKVTRIQPEE